MKKNDKYNIKKDLKDAFNDLKSPKTFKKQIPNLLTASRLFAPLIIVPLAISGNLLAATIVVCATAATDGLDGFFARKLNVKSRLGENLDAFSDKMFTLGITLPLVAFNPILLINLGLEALISKINIDAKLKNADVKSSIIGKAKTVVLFMLLSASYLSLTVPIKAFIIPTLIASTSLLQTGAIIDYKITNNKKIKQGETKKIEQQEIKENEKKNNNELEKEKNILLSIKKSLENEIVEDKEKVLSYKKKS
ncbi:MAG: CDP-alcohol phosphatidyltransferase family protein [Bacilli bacterium]|nr:CDP-alcohol phosphatidyltransferase family protein [Bacilli bacterium]MDD4733480.1 CDP-alcohol phosphatidyltransferase family protein [Bacilli bacterium]